jgi:glycogen debranching enzyme
MLRRCLLAWILCFQFGLLYPGQFSVLADSSKWPSLSAKGSVDRHIEALGTQAGIWGTLSQGLESWVYPFKAFDSLEVGVIDSSGAFRRIYSEIQTQTVTPDETSLVFQGEDWRVGLTFFVPRESQGGTIRFQTSLPKNLELAFRFRPVLTPMHLEIDPEYSMRWYADSRAVSFWERGRDYSLVFGSKGMTQPEVLSDGKVLIRLVDREEDSGLICFSLQSGEPTRALQTVKRMERNFEGLRAASKRYYEGLLSRLPSVTTPDPMVNQALLWAGISLDQLRIRNPDLGWGLVSGYSSSKGATRPKYAWFFEEPTLTSWPYHRLGLSSHIKESLGFLSRYQRPDGKTVHEVSQSLKHWPTFFDDFRYAYMHTDGPVYYLVAYGHYLRSTGDANFIRSHWDVIRRTYEWCKSQIDPEDGLITIDRGDWGSAESSTDILKDTQLEAMWVRALREVAYLAESLGESETSAEALTLLSRAKGAIEESFWDESKGFYIWGINRGGEKVYSMVPHHAVGFWLSELREDRVKRALNTLAGSEFMTDWGVRSLALGDPKFDGASYQSGSVWPVWNAGVLISDFRNGQSVRGFENWRAMIESRWVSGLGPMPEVFRGDHFQLLPDAVPHQMFSEVAIVSGFYEGLLGLEVDVPARLVRLAPRLPMEWDSLEVQRIPFGKETFDLALQKEANRFVIKIDGDFRSPVEFVFRPEISVSGLIRTVEDSRGAPYFQVHRLPLGKQVAIERVLSRGSYELVIEHDEGVEFSLSPEPLTLGRESRNLRVIESQIKGAWWRAIVEGRPGSTYRVDFKFDHPPVLVQGGLLVKSVNGSGFVVETTGSLDLPLNRAGYVRWPLSIKLEKRPDRMNLLVGEKDDSGSVEISARDQWESKVRRIQDRMQQVMGRLPGKERKVALDVVIEEEEDCGSYIRRLVTYQSEVGSRVPAYLLIPKDCLSGAREAFGVLCLHPTDDQVGHKVVVGLGGRAGRNYAEELAKLGFVTIAPSYPLLANYQPDLDLLGYQSGTMKAVWDNTRAIDLLESLDFVIPESVGAIGHSLGGHNAIYTAVFDQRIRVVATSCGFDSFLDYKEGDIRGWTSTRYMPHLLQYELREIPFDFHELVGALAPRGLYVSAPLGDSNFQWESVHQIIESAKPVYSLYDVSASLVVRHPDCGHDFPEENRREAYAFMAAQLEASRARD